MPRARLLTRPFALCSLANLFQGTAFSLFLHFPGFLNRIGASDVEIGFLFGLTGITAILARPPIGRAMDTRGRRGVILLGNAINVSAIALYLCVSAVGPGLYAIRIAHGIAEAMLFTALFTYAADCVPAARRTEGLALFGVSGMLPIALGGLLGDLILRGSGYSALFVAACAFAALSLVLSLPLRDLPRGGAEEEPSRGFRAALTQRDLRPIWGVTFAFALAVAAVFTFVKRFVDETGLASVGGFFSAYSGAAIVLRLAFGWLPDRIGPKRVLYPALGAVVLACALLATATGARQVILAGTLTLPEGPGPFPGAVLVTGSGPQDRDETLFGHKPFLVLSDHLTRAGIAVLRYDDRGVGRSTGDFSVATSEDFTSDALAAVAFLKARKGVGGVGIVGHSEGGIVGPLAAVRSDAVAFVVMLAGPGIPGCEIIQLQSELINRAEGAPEEVIRLNKDTQARLFAIVDGEPDPRAALPLLRSALERASAALPQGGSTPQAIEAQIAQINSPWFRFFLTYDPRPTLEAVTVPVLALNGSLDLQVPAEVNLHEVGAALAKGQNPDATTRLLPGLNHLFQQAETGSPSEYARIPETMNPVALEAVSSWILERLGSR